MARSAVSAHWDEPRLRLPGFDPVPDLWKIVEREAAFVGNVREERYVVPTRYVVARFVLCLVESHFSASAFRAGANSGQL
jgi:hypothetical protein